MALTLYRLRVSTVFVTLVNLTIISVYYGYNQHVTTKDGTPFVPSSLQWYQILTIICSVVLFPSYVYSVWGKKPLVHRFARAGLMFLLGLFLIIDGARVVVGKSIETGRKYSCMDYVPEFFFTLCGLYMASTWANLITGIVVFFEVLATLFRGSVQPAEGDKC